MGEIQIGTVIADFVKRLEGEPHHRYLSWEHCYRCFQNYRDFRHAQDKLDTAALHLGFYLASWGMLRGSSRLLQKDYKFYLPVVETLIEERFDDLWNPLVCQDNTTHLSELIFKREGKKGIGPSLWDTIHKLDGEFEPSDILLTKILLGTMACIPAYDRFAQAGLKQEGLTGSYGKRSYEQIIRFYEIHQDEFEKAQPTKGMTYPPMKLLDMYFFELGQQA
jgi:hypothetical protein